MFPPGRFQAARRVGVCSATAPALAYSTESSSLSQHDVGAGGRRAACFGTANQKKTQEWCASARLLARSSPVIRRWGVAPIDKRSVEFSETDKSLVYRREIDARLVDRDTSRV
jgi:hypothetical protein